MALVSLLTLIVGVVLSSVSGLVCYSGSAGLAGQIDGLPFADLVLSNPATALGLGGLMTVLGAFCQPSRAE